MMAKVEDSFDFEQVYCYKCPKCEFVSQTKSSVLDHLRKVHDNLNNNLNNGTDEAESFASLNFEQIAELTSPVFNTDSYEQLEKLTSPIFDIETPTNKDNGNKTKKSVYPHKCSVDKCPVRMSVAWNVEYHVRCHHQDTFKCPECSVIISPWKAMVLHLWKTHSINLDLLSCHICGYKTVKKELFNFHMNTHSDQKSYLCDTCGKGFKNMKQLRNHKELHSKNRNSEEYQQKNTCPDCGKVLRSSRLLRAHREAIHLKVRSHLCNYCGYNTSSLSNLRIHMRQHTQEKPFACEECDYRTADHNSLRRHRMKHSGQKQYQCPHCSYASIQSSTYKAHLRNKHPDLSDELIFSCQLCSFRTLRKENLDLHVATSHDSNVTGSTRPSLAGTKNEPPE